MQRFNRNIVPATLMVASLLLLAAFQAFWLRKEYYEQKNLLQKEADMLFRATLQALEDSVIQQKVSLSFREHPGQVPQSKEGPVTLQADTLVFFQKEAEGGKSPAHFPGLPASVSKELRKLRGSSGLRAESATGFPPQRIIMRDSGEAGNIEIRIISPATKSDSLKQVVSRVLKPVQTHVLSYRKEIQRNNGSTGTTPPPPAKFIIRLGNDSLRLQDVERAYIQRMQKADIVLPLTVRRSTDAHADSTSGALTTSAVMSSMPMGSFYSVGFTNYQPYLLRRITPQLLFSVFLLAMTALAFAVIYRNLQRQQRLIQLKNDFISNVTHELKTPIATVGVALEALQSFGVDRNPEQTREYLDISRKELDRLSMLVDKVLKMALFEQQTLALTPERLDADELVRQVLSTMKPQLEKYGALCTYEQHGDSFTLLADRVHLTNVLYNLLDNALKYSEGTPTVSIRLSTTDEYIRLEVLDQGIGIPAEYRQRIFEKFFRVPSGNIHNVKGYGLGLSYVASVVKAHQGRIEVESEPRQGSRFTLLLPRDLHPSNTNSPIPSTHDTHQTTVR